jgi:hypothetical protein
LEADKPGLSRFDIALSVTAEESNESNNYRSVYIDIIDDRRKVLVLGNSPHPDLKAIRESVGSNINYEVKVDLASSWKGEFAGYDLVILHQLPSRTSSGGDIRRLAQQSDVPLFVIVGRQTALSTLGELGLGVSFSGRANTTDDVNGKVNPNFSLFQLPENLDDLVTEAPPLQIPFGEWKRANSAEVLLYRKVGRIATEEPLLLFNPLGSKKRGILLGEGLWRWRLTDYAMNENHDRFDDFFTNVVQYLAVKEDKRLFRTEGPGRVRENESLIFRAELYTPAYQPVNDAEVQLIVTDEDGRTYPFNFSRSGTGYRLNAGILPPGNYRYEAFTERGGQRLSDQGSFAVTSFDLESARLRADHELLYTLSDRTGGTLVYPSNVDEISRALLSDDTAPKPVSYNTEVFTSLLNFRWIFFVLLVLLSAEWFMRKYLGKY